MGLRAKAVLFKSNGYKNSLKNITLARIHNKNMKGINNLVKGFKKKYLGQDVDNIPESKLKPCNFLAFKADSKDKSINENYLDYFIKTPQAGIIDLPQILKVKILYTDKKGNKSEEREFKGSFDQMIRKYERLKRTNVRGLVEEGFKKNPDLRKKFIKKELFNNSNINDLNPDIYVSVGLTTQNEDYLIKSTMPKKLSNGAVYKHK